MVLLIPRKKQGQKSYGYWKTLENLWKINVFSNLEGKCQEVKRCAPRGAARNHNAIPWKTMENHWFLHVWLEHFQRMRMGCRVRCPETLEWSLQGRRRKSVNPSATMSGNTWIHPSCPPPLTVSHAQTPLSKKTEYMFLLHNARQT